MSAAPLALKAAKLAISRASDLPLESGLRQTIKNIMQTEHP